MGSCLSFVEWSSKKMTRRELREVSKTSSYKVDVHIYLLLQILICGLIYKPKITFFVNNHRKSYVVLFKYMYFYKSLFFVGLRSSGPASGISRSTVSFQKLWCRHVTLHGFLTCVQEGPETDPHMFLSVIVICTFH